ncbi:MAG: serine/threonine-protein kinase [Paludibaculum sp.]
MNPERFRRLEALYDEAAAMDPGARTLFIDEQCAGDDELRRELLAAFRDGSSGFTGVVEHAAAGAAGQEDDRAGHRMGSYRIVRPLGRGGMGAVYLAVRDDDEFHKEVAIKTLKFELEGGSAVSRFRQERQILAHLEHPNIARLLDGGTTGNGTPYIVLEYVAGLPITDWCQQRHLSVDQILKLFRQVCDAVQYAHQHLVVHRDIKPGNILVTPEGVPKLLDFGIAKLLDAGSTGGMPALTATAAGAQLLTPDYASPEQVRGEPASTAADVYSLGAVLFQLLTGERPHLLQNYDAVEIARVVCDTEIRLPSSLGNRRLAGDLDVIVTKAMQKQPERRYRSVVEFSEDIRRHLEGLPIAARRDTSFYRAVKFVRRHRVGVAAVSAVVLALAVGMGVSIYEARLAQRRFAQVRELANTFLFQFYDQVTPLAGSTAIRASILQTAQTYLDGLTRESGRDQGLILELAQSYQRLGDVQGRTGAANLGQVEQARRSYRTAIDLYGRLGVGPASPPDLRLRLAKALWALGRLEYNVERMPDADPPTRRMLDLLPAGATDAETRRWRAVGERSLGDIRLREGRGAEAVTLLESSLKGLNSLRGAVPQEAGLSKEISDCTRRLARARVAVGDLDGALRDLQLLSLPGVSCDGDAAPAPECRDEAVRLTWAGDVYGAVDRPNLGEPDKAAVLYEKALRISERFAALDRNDRQVRFDLAARCGKLGDVVWRKDPRRAIALYDRALATARDLVSKEHLEILQGAYFVAIARPLVQLKRLTEARTITLRNLEAARAEAANSYAELLGEFGVQFTWANLLMAEGKRQEALHVLDELIRREDAARTAHPQDLAPTYYLTETCRYLASITSGSQRREALLRSAAAWHAWPATSFTKREEQKDLQAANR